MNLVCPFQSAEHAIIQSEVIDWARRECPDRDVVDKLFMYRHKVYETFVIAMWTREGWFMDVLNIGKSLESFDRVQAKKFKDMFDDAHRPDELARQMRESDLQRKRDDTDESHEYHDEFTRRRSSKVLVGAGT